MNNIALDLGIIQIYWYSIFIILGITIASLVIYKELKKNKSENLFFDLAFNTIVIGVIGARLYYVGFNLSYYLNEPLEILQIWNGGLAIHGGIIFGCIYLIRFCKKYNYKLLKLLDIIVVGLIIAQSIGRWGNFFNQEAYGMITSVAELQSKQIPQFIIDRMYILGEYRQPMFFYESIWNLFGFVALLIVRTCPKIRNGQITGVYLIWYSLGRFLIEIYRSDSLMISNYKIAQIISIIFGIIGVILIFRGIFKRKNNELYHEEGLRYEI